MSMGRCWYPVESRLGKLGNSISMLVLMDFSVASESIIHNTLLLSPEDCRGAWKCRFIPLSQS